MIINALQVREGMIIVIDDELYRVTWTMHRTPGKGDACMQTKLKNIMNGKNLEHRFRSSDKVEKASLSSRKMQYLYQEDESYVFMDQETFDQISVHTDIIGEKVVYLKEGNDYDVSVYEESIVSVDFPNSMIFEVAEAPPEVRKATASASLRPITLENGMVINAPAFIKQGDKVKVNIDTKEYIERV